MTPRTTRTQRRITRTLGGPLAATAGLLLLGGCEKAGDPEQAVPSAGTSAGPSASQPTAPSQTQPPETTPAELSNTMIGDGLQFMADSSWVSSQPTSSMRFAQFSIPVEQGDQAAELVVYYFGDTGAGSIDANITRWLGQIAQPDGSDTAQAATISERTLGGMTARTVDVTGTYVAETSPGSGEFNNKPDWRLVAAIVQTQAGPYYFKLTGPDAVVSQCLGSYQAMLETIQPAAITGENEAAGHPG